MHLTTKQEKEPIIITLNSRPYEIKRSIRAMQFRVLPSLKRAPLDEPVNFLRYQRTKRAKKVELTRKHIIQDLFLEGEYFVSGPEQLRPKKAKHSVLDITTIPQFNQKETSRTHSKHKNKSYVSAGRCIAKQQQNECNTQVYKNDQFTSPNQIKMHNSTFHRPKQASKTSFKVIRTQNKSLSTIKSTEIDRQKQTFFLDKKQLQKIKAQSFIVMQYPSLKILTGNRFRNQGEIASLTKIMTFYTVIRLSIEFKLDLTSQIVIVDEAAANMTGTSAELVNGDVITVEQLLYGLMLPSGNDAAVSLATWGGSLIQHPEDVSHLQMFVSLMNKYSRELQLKNSHFGNPHGLPNFRNTSSPYDVAILTSECLNFPLFLKITSTQVYKLWIKNQNIMKQLIWQNTNKLIRRQGFVGVKTGVTVTAGPCLATCYEFANKKFIVVLLRTSKLSRRFKQTRMILGWTLKRYDESLYGQAARKMLKNDIVLDSDNSEDQQQFIYDKMDAQEIAKRNKILQFEL